MSAGGKEGSRAHAACPVERQIARPGPLGPTDWRPRCERAPTGSARRGARPDPRGREPATRVLWGKPCTHPANCKTGLAIDGRRPVKEREPARPRAVVERGVPKGRGCLPTGGSLPTPNPWLAKILRVRRPALARPYVEQKDLCHRARGSRQILLPEPPAACGPRLCGTTRAHAAVRLSLGEARRSLVAWPAEGRTEESSRRSPRRRSVTRG